MRQYIDLTGFDARVYRMLITCANCKLTSTLILTQGTSVEENEYLIIDSKCPYCGVASMRPRNVEPYRKDEE